MKSQKLIALLLAQFLFGGSSYVLASTYLEVSPPMDFGPCLWAILLLVTRRSA